MAFVRPIHAAPGAPALALYANGSPQGDTLNFAEIGTYVQLPAGLYRFQLVPLGSSAGTAPEIEVQVRAGRYYTVAAAGLVPDSQLVVFDDEYRALAQGRPGVRVYHLSPDAPAIDLVDGSDRLISNLPFPAASQVVEVPSGSTRSDLQIVPATVSRPVLIQLDRQRLQSGIVNDIFILNELAKIDVTVVPNNAVLAMPAALPNTSGPGLPGSLVVLSVLLMMAGVWLQRPFRTMRTEQTPHEPWS